MRYFDLHCDTMTECALKNIPLRRNLLHVDLDTVQGWERYVQCYAVWLPDELRGEPAWQRFLQVQSAFRKRWRKMRDASGNCVPQTTWTVWRKAGGTEPS